MSNKITKKDELKLTQEFAGHMDDTKHDLRTRVNGVPAKAGASGFQFAGYTTLERFYRGDQWSVNEPPGASQRTDNYCAVIVDNLSSLIFDDAPEINCPTDDPSDEILEIKAELKESLIWKVWKDNNYEVEFDAWAKGCSLYGDGFIKGPWAEKVDKNGNTISSDTPGGTWKIRFSHIENPGSIRLVYADGAYTKILGFIDTTKLSFTKAMMLYGEAAAKKGITLSATIQNSASIQSRSDPDTLIPMVEISEYWTDKGMSIFVGEKLLSHFEHNWGFVPLVQIKNNYVPNYPYGKSDLEDVLDPQLMHNRTNNDLANFLKWITTVNFWGKNIESMQTLVAGLSRIYSVPDDGELHTFEKPGDPYITNTFAQQRRTAIIEISGVSESILSSSQISNASGRAMAMAFQGTIRKLNPRSKRFRIGLQELNKNILKLWEIYFPKSKVIIGGDYRNEVFLPITLLRNIVDTINKLQSGIISQETAMRESGVQQPKMEKKVMKKDLMDPILGPQVARQPSLLPRLSEGENQQGDQPNPAPGNQPGAGQEGSVAANNSQAGGAASVPTVSE